MLYSFSNLSKYLTENGYPESNSSGFRVIKRDLTREENAGNIDFRDDGVYLTIDGQEYKGYMYLKYPNIGKYGLPKFHITKCRTIKQQRANNRFNGRYFWHNSNTVTIEDRSTGEVEEDVTLDLCWNCSQQALGVNYGDTEGFFDTLEKGEIQNFEDEIKVDIFGYPLNWEKISREYRKMKNYACENCGISILDPMGRRFIHTHHRNGNKLDNRKDNLECLCVLCHSSTDERHQHNFERRRMKKEVNSFIEKYRKELEDVNNEYI